MASKKASVNVLAAPLSRYGVQLTALAMTHDIATDIKASRIPIFDMSAPLPNASKIAPEAAPSAMDHAKACASAPPLAAEYKNGAIIHAEMTNVRNPRNLTTTRTLKASPPPRRPYDRTLTSAI
jgi:hypothetical protein